MLTNYKNIEKQIVIISSTEHTPKVEFDGVRGTYAITGNACNIDPKLFWEPLINWGKAFAKTKRKNSKFDFYFNHINSASTAYVLKFIRTLATGDSAIDLFWYIKKTEDYDADMVEILQELIQDKINIIYL